MAGAAPWTVMTTKRKPATNTPVPRKRRRASSPVEDWVGFKERRRKQQQQTLTQNDWVASRPVSFDGGELEHLEVKTEPRSWTRRGVPRLKKKDSTLTQMDFFGGQSVGVGMYEADLKPLTITTLPEGCVPQLDGTYDSPRKPRPSKSSDVQAGLHRKRKSVPLQAEESQEYVPTTKRKKGKAKVEDMSDHVPRTSSRHASKVPSDPAENFALFQGKFADAVPPSRAPLLEIKDSIESDEGAGFNPQLQTAEPFYRDVAQPSFEAQDSVVYEHENLGGPLVLHPRQAPQTPQKTIRYIPSSQSPESLPPTTTKRLASHGKQGATPNRKPLAQLSINTPTRLPVLDAGSPHKKYSTTKRKICALKLPTVPRGSMKERVEDCQADIWSVQPTSSPKANNDNIQADRAAALQESVDEEARAEIPATSQVQNDVAVTSSPPQHNNGETQESLMSLSAIFGIEKKCSTKSNDGASQQAARESNMESRDPVLQAEAEETPRKATQYVCFLDTQPQYDDDTMDNHDGSDFGSPIANDTQFVAGVQARIPTSPLSSSVLLKRLKPHDTIHISSSPSSGAGDPTSPLAAPQLVDRVEYQNSTTTIPTKDVSSPVLPPMPPPTQRPIVPASLPHPSQVSTQEPSQQLPQLSSVPQLRSPAQTDRITIKDSSSMHTPLSQLPAYQEDELQLHRELRGTQHNIHDDGDEDDENDYDDLDPRTPRKVPQVQESAPGPDLPEKQNVAHGSAPQEVNFREEQAGVPDPSPPSPQANFTQNGHVTAARIANMRRRGLIPPGYQPPQFRVRPARELLPAWMFEDDDDEEL